MLVKLKKILEQRISRLGNKEKIEVGLIAAKWQDTLLVLIEESKINPALLTELSSSRPIKLQNGVLTIETKDQAISSELSLLGFDLMDKLNQSVGKRAIKRLFFKIKRQNNV